MIQSLPPLPISQLHLRHPGVSQPVNDSYCEAASVCFSRHHSSPVSISIIREANGEPTRSEYLVEWSPPDEIARRAWANDDDATRDGAYAVILAAVEAEMGLVATRRAETRTGADYYLGYISNMDDLNLEDAFRLEVSGVDHGNQATVNARLAEKIAQMRRGRSNLPALAGVTGFRIRVALLEEVR